MTIFPMTGESAELPPEFVERLRELVPAADLLEVLASFSAPKRVGFRVNTLLSEPTVVWQELTDQGLLWQPVPWYAAAGWVEAAHREALLSSEPVRRGAIYVQNLSSQLAVIVLDPQPGEEILDLAAAPGGKTLLIAALTQPRVPVDAQGRLAAVEAVRGRFYRLQANLQHYGAPQVKTYLADGRTIGGKTACRFDRVLLDAPCSSESRFHTSDPDSWSRWSSRKIREQARKQIGLLRSALTSLKVGGTMVYCTCSFAPEENELVVQKQLEWFGDAVEVLPMELPPQTTGFQFRPGLTVWQGEELSGDLTRCGRILPTAEHAGFFLCKLQKNRELGIEATTRRRKYS